MPLRLAGRRVVSYRRDVRGESGAPELGPLAWFRSTPDPVCWSRTVAILPSGPFTESTPSNGTSDLCDRPNGTSRWLRAILVESLLVGSWKSDRSGLSFGNNRSPSNVLLWPHAWWTHQSMTLFVRSSVPSTNQSTALAVSEPLVKLATMTTTPFSGQLWKQCT